MKPSQNPLPSLCVWYSLQIELGQPQYVVIPRRQTHLVVDGTYTRIIRAHVQSNISQAARNSNEYEHSLNLKYKNPFIYVISYEMFTFFVTSIYQLLVSPSHRSCAGALNVCAAAVLSCFPNLARSIRRSFRPGRVEKDFRDVGRCGDVLIPCSQPSRLPIVDQVQCSFLLRYFKREKIKNFYFGNVFAV